MTIPHTQSPDVLGGHWQAGDPRCGLGIVQGSAQEQFLWLLLPPLSSPSLVTWTWPSQGTVALLGSWPNQSLLGEAKNTIKKFNLQTHA